MIPYHGSNQDIKEIDLTKIRPNKDFGQGFYLTEDKEQAMKMAEQKLTYSRPFRNGIRLSSGTAR